MGVIVRSMVSIVPKETIGLQEITERFGEENAIRISKTTGVNKMHIANARSTLELAYEAGVYAIQKAGITAQDIDGLLMVTQTPEYRLPSTACILQDKLGMGKSTFALDIGLGCSGFPYGFLTAKSLIESKILNRVLLICGDVTSMNAAPEDQSTYPLFADGFGAVIIEECSNVSGSMLGYAFGTDGSGWKNLVIHTGLSHHKTLESFYTSGDNERYPQVQYPDYVYMDGSQIFTFCLREVPPMVEKALENAKLSKDEIDVYCFHQANGFLINHIRNKIGIPKEKVPMCMDRYGNTSSSSAILAACDYFRDKPEAKKCKIAFVAFGVGYSWSTVIMDMDSSVIGEIQEV